MKSLFAIRCFKRGANVILELLNEQPCPVVESMLDGHREFNNELFNARGQAVCSCRILLHR